MQLTGARVRFQIFKRGREKKKKTLFVSSRSLGARVQPDRGVLQEALPDGAAPARAGPGAAGRAGPETLGPLHPEDPHGQTLAGRSLRHQGSRTFAPGIR